jgi:PadR family transcriptional regulator PadR
VLRSSRVPFPSISKAALEVNQGSLYPALYRLEKRRWLRSEWGIADSGRDAKFYSLTRAGSKRLEIERTEWSRISEAIALVLKTVSQRVLCATMNSRKSFSFISMNVLPI